MQSEGPIYQALHPYIDLIGWVQDRYQFRLSGNGPCYTAEAALTMFQNGEDPCKLMSAVAICEVEPGLFIRHTDERGFRNEQISIDDVTGFALLSHLCDPNIAKRILKYMRDHHWKVGPFKLPYFYQTPGVNERLERAWLGRFPSLIACLQWAAGERVSLWRKLWFAASIATTNVTIPDRARLSRMMIAIHDGKTWLGRLAENRYRRKMVEHWAPGSILPQAMSEMYRAYFATNPNGPHHPIGSWAHR